MLHNCLEQHMVQSYKQSLKTSEFKYSKQCGFYGSFVRTLRTEQ